MEEEQKRIRNIQERLKEGKALTSYSNEELKYLQKPIGKGIYKSTIGRPRKKEEEKCKPNDRIVCDICNGEFIRSHRWDHNKTKIHQAYLKMNNKIKKLLLDEND